MKIEGTGVGYKVNLSDHKIGQAICPFRALFLSVILSLILVFPSDAQYTLQDEDVVVTDGVIESCSYDFEIKDIIIPDTLDGQEVRGIADGAVMAKEYCVGVFSEKGIQEVVFPSTLERIGDCAFAANNLNRIDLTGCPDLIFIGNCAFWYNYDLVSVDLSGCSALKEIKSYVFYDNYITDLSLSGCSALESIGYMAFIGNAIANLDLSDCSSLRIFESHAFDGNPLTEVNFSESTALEEIRSGAFKGCNLITLDLSSCPSLAVIEPYAFTDNHLTSINLNGCISLKTIGASAFYMNDLENVNLQGCPVLSEIGSGAFFRNRISKIDFSGCDNLRSIGDFAFSENELDTLDLAECSAMEKIGMNAFANNLSLDSFALPVNIVYENMGWRDHLGKDYQGGEVVRDLSSNYYVPIPYTLTAADFWDGSASNFCTYDFEYTDVVIPDTIGGDTVTYIGVTGAENGIFYNKPVTSVILPSTLETIGRYAFRKNSNLRSLNFSQCGDLKAIELSAIVENAIEQLDLSACSSLNKIGDYAFYDNELSQIDLKNCTHLVSIGENAFILNPMQSFVLPVPDIPGHLFNHWRDGEGNVYEGGDSTHNLYTTYTADLTALYTVTFIVTDGTNPVLGAEVSFGDYGTSVTDLTGQAIFTDVLAEKEISFTVSFPGYNDVAGAISVYDSDVSEAIKISLTTYTLTINLTDGTSPVPGANVSLPAYGTVVSDSAGVAVFNGILPEDDLVFTVNAHGYENLTGNISIVDDDVEVTVTLLKVSGSSDVYENHFRIYPNPSNEIISIETNLFGQLLIEITSLNGQLILREIVNESTHNVELSNFPKGVYFITIRSKDFVTTRKILKL